MTTKNPTTGVIGLGAMGAAMAANLAKTGQLACIWNRTAGRAQALARTLGVQAAATPAELAARCDVVLLSVSGDADVLAVVAALSEALKPGAVVIDTSTVASDTAREAAARLAAHGVEFLDAPVSGGVEGAKAGSLVMMVGGEAQALARVEPVLKAIAARVLHMGPVGSGQATKAVNQIMAAGINQAVTEALAFGQTLGLPMDKVIEAVSSGAAGNWFLERRGRSMLAGEFPPGFKIGLHHKDLLLCKQMAEGLNAQLPIVEMTLIHYRRLIAEGFGDEDISALFRQKQRLFPDAENPGDKQG